MERSGTAAKRRATASGFLLAMFLVASVFAAGPAHARTFTVDVTADLPDPNPGDDACVVSIFGGCTLRAAIEQANATDGADTIRFNIPGSGPHTISPASGLPFITETLTIDGYSQPGASPNTNPALAQGSNAAPKIELNGSGAGQFAGGLLIKNTAPNSVVRGLTINRFAGPGITVEPGGRGNRVEGNFIGTDPGGTQDLGNGGSGVNIGGLTGGKNTVGGVTPASRNVISGNGGSGVDVGSSGNRVQGNYLGTRKDGVGGLGNSGSGVRIGHLGNTVGGAEATAANVIAFNGEDGVVVINSGATGNRLLRNAIFSNAGLCIDLGNNGVTPNDARERDTGPNALQNFPVIASATASGATTTIRGTLESTPKRTFTLQFFQGPPGPSGNETFIGQRKVETNRRGKASFVFSTNLPIPLGRQVSATATSGGGNTSELSGAVTLVAG